MRERIAIVMLVATTWAGVPAHGQGLKVYISADMEGTVGTVTGDQLVALVAALGPAQRGLRIQPTEVLKEL